MTERDVDERETEPAGEETARDRVVGRDGCSAGQDEGAAKSDGNGGTMGRRLGGDSRRWPSMRETRELQRSLVGGELKTEMGDKRRWEKLKRNREAGSS